MLCGAQVAVCCHINTKQINTVWEERTIVEFYARCCITWSVSFTSLIYGEFIDFIIKNEIYLTAGCNHYVRIFEPLEIPQL